MTVGLTALDDVRLATMDDGRANALGFEAIAALQQAVDDASASGQPLVIAGRPGRFSGGFDLAVLAEGQPTLGRLLEVAEGLFLSILRAPVPVVAACTGHAVAAGALLLLCCDHRVGEPTAAGSSREVRIGLPEVGIGMALPTFAITLAQRRLAASHLVRATTFGTTFGPEQAVAAGFLDEVATDAVEGALAFGRGCAALPAVPLAVTKQQLNAGWVERLAGESLLITPAAAR
jgi:enoyl-CoA hydratase